MELDDLKQTWEEYDRQLDAAIRLNKRLLRESVLDKAQTALRRLSRLLLAELLFILAAALWLGSFLWENGAETRFLVPALALHVCVIVLAVAAIRQIVAVSRVDYGTPIVAIQRRMELLRIERIKTTKWALLLAPLVWTPVLIVTAKSFLDVDVYAAFGAVWLGANLLFGLLALTAGAWISRRWAGRMQRSSLLRQLLRDIAGQNLTAASDFLQSLSQLESEESAVRNAARDT